MTQEASKRKPYTSSKHPLTTLVQNTISLFNSATVTPWLNGCVQMPTILTNVEDAND